MSRPKGVHFRFLLDNPPRVHPSAFVAEGARLVGDVTLAKDTSVWFNAVLRADIHSIRIGEGSNIQDGSVLHVSNEQACIVGKGVTVGHNVNLHGCTVEDSCLIGIGAIVLTGARVGKGSLVGAGAVVLENMKIPAGSLVLGAPARIVRKLTGAEIAKNKMWGKKYVRLKNSYQKQLRS
jgi:carbonic anhydrase/acetyltransferase-like protein (isoleucine patch superfamily)